MALAAYRSLLRSSRIAFQGDTQLLAASRDTARQNFNAMRSLSPESNEAKAGIAHAEEVSRVLRRNVVQGERINQNEGEKYQLRIHPEIERGDNASIKMGGSGKIEVTGGCCGVAQYI